MISNAQIDQTAAALAEWQLPSGQIPWFPGGHADPWNHIEAAMALDVTGHTDAALAAYDWLVRIQRPDGAWHQYYIGDDVEQDKLDANCVAYIAAGVWHHYLLSGDTTFLARLWPTVDRAVEFVLGLQQPRGEIRWARHGDGTPWSFALLTGSSSMCHSLRCALAIANELGEDRPAWELSTAKLAHAIRNEPKAFAPKERWAMDWYYPVLGGAVTGDAARERLAAGWDKFVLDNRGVRCVSDQPWVTAAETCECALAHLAVGERERAEQLFSWAMAARDTDGRYWTGTVYPQEVHFPAEEKSTYTSAAVILTADALLERSSAHGLFTRHDDLPSLIRIEASPSHEPAERE